MTNTLGMLRLSRLFLITDVFLALLFLIYYVYIGGLLFDADFDYTHEYFYSLIQDTDFIGVIENFVATYSRLEIGYALIARPFAAASVSYINFMNIWTWAIVYIVLRLSPQAILGKIIRLIFLGSSTQLMAMLQFSATGKAFITIYLIALLVTRNNITSSFIGATGHIQSLGMLSLGDILRMLRIFRGELRPALIIIILLVVVAVFDFDSTLLIAFELLTRGSSFYNFDARTMLLLLASGVFTAIIFITLKSRALLETLVKIVMKAPVALFVELAMRTNRFTVNIALWLILYKGPYALWMLTIGIVYNFFKIMPYILHAYTNSYL